MSVGISHHYERESSPETPPRDAEVFDSHIFWSGGDGSSSPDSEGYESDSRRQSSSSTIPTSRNVSPPSAPSAVMHTPPASPPSKLAITLPSTNSPSKSHPYPRPTILVPNSYSRPVRSRGLGLTPMSSSTSSNSQPLPLGTGTLPKSQPLARALFARKASGDIPHAGMTGVGKKKATGQKMIVPTKSFRTTFELGLTASEFARKA